MSSPSRLPRFVSATQSTKASDSNNDQAQISKAVTHAPPSPRGRRRPERRLTSITIPNYGEADSEGLCKAHNSDPGPETARMLVEAEAGEHGVVGIDPLFRRTSEGDMPELVEEKAKGNDDLKWPRGELTLLDSALLPKLEASSKEDLVMQNIKHTKEIAALRAFLASYMADVEQDKIRFMRENKSLHAELGNEKKSSHRVGRYAIRAGDALTATWEKTKHLRQEQEIRQEEKREMKLVIDHQRQQINAIQELNKELTVGASEALLKVEAKVVKAEKEALQFKEEYESAGRQTYFLLRDHKELVLDMLGVEECLKDLEPALEDIRYDMIHAQSRSLARQPTSPSPVRTVLTPTGSIAFTDPFSGAPIEAPAPTFTDEPGEPVPPSHRAARANSVLSADIATTMLRRYTGKNVQMSPSFHFGDFQRAGVASHVIEILGQSSIGRDLSKPGVPLNARARMSVTTLSNTPPQIGSTRDFIAERKPVKISTADQGTSTDDLPIMPPLQNLLSSTESSDDSYYLGAKDTVDQPAHLVNSTSVGDLPVKRPLGYPMLAKDTSGVWVPGVQTVDDFRPYPMSRIGHERTQSIPLQAFSNSPHLDFKNKTTPENVPDVITTLSPVAYTPDVPVTAEYLPHDFANGDSTTHKSVDNTEKSPRTPSPEISYPSQDARSSPFSAGLPQLSAPQPPHSGRPSPRFAESLSSDSVQTSKDATRLKASSPVWLGEALAEVRRDPSTSEEPSQQTIESLETPPPRIPASPLEAPGVDTGSQLFQPDEHSDKESVVTSDKNSDAPVSSLDNPDNDEWCFSRLVATKAERTEKSSTSPTETSSPMTLSGSPQSSLDVAQSRVEDILAQVETSQGLSEGIKDPSEVTDIVKRTLSPALKSRGLEVRAIPLPKDFSDIKSQADSGYYTDSNRARSVEQSSSSTPSVRSSCERERSRDGKRAASGSRGRSPPYIPFDEVNDDAVSPDVRPDSTHGIMTDLSFVSRTAPRLSTPDSTSLDVEHTPVVSLPLPKKSVAFDLEDVSNGPASFPSYDTHLATSPELPIFIQPLQDRQVATSEHEGSPQHYENFPVHHKAPSVYRESSPDSYQDSPVYYEDSPVHNAGTNLVGDSCDTQNVNEGDYPEPVHYGPSKPPTSSVTPGYSTRAPTMVELLENGQLQADQPRDNGSSEIANERVAKLELQEYPRHDSDRLKDAQPAVIWLHEAIPGEAQSQLRKPSGVHYFSCADELREHSDVFARDSENNKLAQTTGFAVESSPVQAKKSEQDQLPLQLRENVLSPASLEEEVSTCSVHSVEASGTIEVRSSPTRRPTSNCTAESKPALRGLVGPQDTNTLDPQPEPGSLAPESAMEPIQNGVYGHFELLSPTWKFPPRTPAEDETETSKPDDEDAKNARHHEPPQQTTSLATTLDMLGDPFVDKQETGLKPPKIVKYNSMAPSPAAGRGGSAEPQTPTKAGKIFESPFTSKLIGSSRKPPKLSSCKATPKRAHDSGGIAEPQTPTQAGKKFESQSTSILPGSGRKPPKLGSSSATPKRAIDCVNTESPSLPPRPKQEDVSDKGKEAEEEAGDQIQMKEDDQSDAASGKVGRGTEADPSVADSGALQQHRMHLPAQTPKALFQAKEAVNRRQPLSPTGSDGSLTSLSLRHVETRKDKFPTRDEAVLPKNVREEAARIDKRAKPRPAEIIVGDPSKFQLQPQSAAGQAPAPESRRGPSSSDDQAQTLAKALERGDFTPSTAPMPSDTIHETTPQSGRSQGSEVQGGLDPEADDFPLLSKILSLYRSTPGVPREDHALMLQLRTELDDRVRKYECSKAEAALVGSSPPRTPAWFEDWAPSSNYYDSNSAAPIGDLNNLIQSSGSAPIETNSKLASPALPWTPSLYVPKLTIQRRWSAVQETLQNRSVLDSSNPSSRAQSAQVSPAMDEQFPSTPPTTTIAGTKMSPHREASLQQFAIRKGIHRDSEESEPSFLHRVDAYDASTSPDEDRIEMIDQALATIRQLQARRLPRDNVPPMRVMQSGSSHEHSADLDRLGEEMRKLPFVFPGERGARLSKASREHPAASNGHSRPAEKIEEDGNTNATNVHQEDVGGSGPENSLEDELREIHEEPPDSDASWDQETGIPEAPSSDEIPQHEAGLEEAQMLDDLPLTSTGGSCEVSQDHDLRNFGNLGPAAVVRETRNDLSRWPKEEDVTRPELQHRRFPSLTQGPPQRERGAQSRVNDKPPALPLATKPTRQPLHTQTKSSNDKPLPSPLNKPLPPSPSFTFTIIGTIIEMCTMTVMSPSITGFPFHSLGSTSPRLSRFQTKGVTFGQICRIVYWTSLLFVLLAAWATMMEWQDANVSIVKHNQVISWRSEFLGWDPLEWLAYRAAVYFEFNKHLMV